MLPVIPFRLSPIPQRSLLLFPITSVGCYFVFAGAKVKPFFVTAKTFLKFFLFLFSKASNPLLCLSTEPLSVSFVLESGCKSSAFLHSIQTFRQVFFENLLIFSTFNWLSTKKNLVHRHLYAIQHPHDTPSITSHTISQTIRTVTRNKKSIKRNTKIKGRKPRIRTTPKLFHSQSNQIEPQYTLTIAWIILRIPPPARSPRDFPHKSHIKSRINGDEHLSLKKKKRWKKKNMFTDALN